MNKHLVRLVKVAHVLTVSAFMTACPAGSGLKSLLLSPQSLTLPVGSTASVKAFGAGSDRIVSDVTDSLEWKAAEPGIVEVNAGSIRALRAGRTTVEAVDASSAVSAALEVIVTDAQVTGLAIAPAAPALPLGVSQPFTATATYSDGTIADATGLATWSSSDTSLASITERGVLSTHRVGALSIRAALGSVRASLEVRVSSAELSQVVVSASRTLVPQGTQLQLKAMGLYSDGSMLEITTSAQWSVADATRASVSNLDGSRGLFTGISAGLTEVLATDPVSGKSGSISLGVSNSELVRIELAHPGLNVPVLNNGETVAMRATGVYTDSTTADLTSLVVWSSSVSSVATVTPGGVVQSRTAGESEIIATFGSTVARVRFRVAAPVLRRIEINAPTVALRLGDTFALGATAVYSDGTTQDVTKRVTWMSASASALLISQDVGSEGVLWMGRASTPTQISATLGSFSASATITSANPASLPFFTTAFRLSANPIVKRSIFWMSSRIDYGGALGGRELIPVTTVAVTARSAGVTVTLLDGPGLKGQIWVDGPTGGTFTLTYTFPFALGGASPVFTLP